MDKGGVIVFEANNADFKVRLSQRGRYFHQNPGINVQENRQRCYRCAVDSLSAILPYDCRHQTMHHDEVSCTTISIDALSSLMKAHEAYLESRSADEVHIVLE